MMMFGRSHGKLGIEFIALAVITACSSMIPSAGKSPVLEPTPTQASIASSTPTAGLEFKPPVEIFNLDSANTIPPEDIIAEVHYEGAGGGDGYRGDCYNAGPEYPVAAFYNQKIVRDEQELLTPLRLVVCGWEPEEQIELKINTPDGRSASTLLTSTLSNREEIRVYTTEYVYFPSIDSPEGIYSFTFTGTKGVIKYSINYVASSSPSAYVIFFDDLERDTQLSNINLPTIEDKEAPLLVLSGYTPEERVRLFLYRGGYFGAWQEYEIDYQGRLSIQLKEFDGVPVVIGDKSTVEIHPVYYPAGFILYIDRLDPIYITCEGVVPTRLKIGDYASVSTTTSLSNRLRSEPTTKSEILDKLAPGTLMEIVDGPKCSDGILWWLVKGVDKDFEGWTGEGDTEYWLVPCYSKDYC